MILLVANPSSARSSLATFLENEHLSTRVCDSLEEAYSIYVKAPQFSLVVAEYRVSDGTVLTLMADLVRKGHAVPFIVLGASLRSEAELFKRGAVACHSGGYSPRSVALQCSSLTKFFTRRRLAPSKVSKKPATEFSFGTVQVSPERRVVQGRGRGSRAVTVPLSGLQMRILQALQSSPSKILDYESLYHSIWRRAYRGNNAAIREAVSTLRERLRQAGVDFDQWVTTVYGEGYRYDGN